MALNNIVFIAVNSVLAVIALVATDNVRKNKPSSKVEITKMAMELPAEEEPNAQTKSSKEDFKVISDKTLFRPDRTEIEKVEVVEETKEEPVAEEPKERTEQYEISGITIIGERKNAIMIISPRSRSRSSRTSRYTRSSRPSTSTKTVLVREGDKLGEDGFKIKRIGHGVVEIEMENGYKEEVYFDTDDASSLARKKVEESFTAKRDAAASKEVSANIKKAQSVLSSLSKTSKTASRTSGRNGQPGSTRKPTTNTNRGNLSQQDIQKRRAEMIKRLQSLQKNGQLSGGRTGVGSSSKSSSGSKKKR